MKPRRLNVGDRVGVVAPAGVVDPVRLEDGARALEGLGFRVSLAEGLTTRRGYLAGDDARRLAELQAMLATAEVRALFCARGGYGSQRIVPSIDWQAFAAAPKPIVGYSDVTALLTAATRAGTTAFHGPMVAGDFARGLSERARRHLVSTLSDPSYRWQLEVPTAIRPGRATGRLVGGCLSVLASALGTPWAVDTDGAVLFLEDVHELPYRIDRLLTHLRQAGRLDRVAGVVFGTMAGCRPHDGLEALDVVRELFAEAPYPVGFGLPAGHTTTPSDVDNLVLPLGVEVALDTDRGSLVALEGAVA